MCSGPLLSKVVVRTRSGELQNMVRRNFHFVEETMWPWVLCKYIGEIGWTLVLELLVKCLKKEER